MSKRAESFPLHRREVAKTLLGARDDLLVVTGLGSTNWDFTAAGDCARIFPLWGAMGGAVPTGLGLALAQAIVHDAGGTITLSNRDGGGLLAVIALPLPRPTRHA